MGYKDPDKQREYQRKRLVKARRDWVLANGPCAECGSWSDLEVDHEDRSSKVDHKVWSWREKRRLKELKKCQVLCKECHKKKTAKENERPITHGTRGGYSRGCHCDECKFHQSERMKAYHEKNGR